MDTRLADIQMNIALYKAHIGKKCFNADGTWVVGGVSFLVRELRTHTEGIKELNAEAVLRCEHIVETLAKRYTGALDQRTLDEIYVLFEDAALVAIKRFPGMRWRDRTEAEFVREASDRIARNVKRLVQPDA